MNSVVAVASLASAAAVASPSISPIANGTDEIFAAIERHRSASLMWMKTLSDEEALERSIPSDRRQSYTTHHRHDPEVGRDDDPRWTEYQARYWQWSDEMAAAAIQLVDLVPTSTAGVIALVAHIDECNSGSLVVSWNNRSCEALFPEELIDEDELDHHGKPRSLSYHSWILRNVRKALQQINAADRPVQAQLVRAVSLSSQNPPADRLLELVAAYEAGIAKTDDMSTYVGMPQSDWDGVYEKNVLPPMRALATEQPPARSAEGAIAAIDHVMKDEDLFGDRGHGMRLMALWAMLRGAQSYIAAAAAKGDIDRNVRLLPLIRAVG